jgi:signal transduction histidine kinase
MDLLNSRKTKARKTYETYWESYSKGDLETFASTLDDHYEMIGTSETEVCHSKADGIAFLKAQMHEVVGKVEMRNRQIDVQPVENLMLINEQCDVYVLTDSDSPADTQNWNFYSKIRLSTILRETESGWKVTQQHGSFPDMRVQEGETLAIEKINKENLELRDAVKRRTAELENKNRELAIEAALEKVRAVAMGMKKPEDMLDVCREISDRLQDFGVTKIRNVQTAIIDETIGQYLCYQYFTPYEKTAVEKTEYLKSPVEHSMVKQMLASRDGYFIGRLSGMELEDFRIHRKEENHFPDPFLDKATALDYCFLSIGEGGLGLTLYQPITEDVLTLFKRFHQVFSLAYQRFWDIQKAEAQAREAQIEVALERTRTQSMLMQHSDEIKSISNIFHEQLLLLGIPSEFSYVWLPDEASQSHQFWASWSEKNEGATTLQSKQVTYPLDKTEPYTAACYAAWANPDVILEEFIPPSDIAGFFEVWQELLAGATKLKADFFPEGIYYSEAYMRYGCFGINIRRKLSEAEKNILKRFSIEFERAYTRFLDLKKAELQAREAQIEAALERVRAQTMAMHSSEDVGKCVVKMFSELTALGVDEGTRFGIGILNHENENNQLWTARKDGEEVNMHIGNIDMSSHPLLKSARKAWKEQIPLHKYVLEGADLLNYYQMLNKAPDYKIQIPIEKLPKKEIQHCFIFEHGFFYAFSPREFQPDLILITKRFSSLFEQTYRRYLDLVRAEGQAREAEIELALERVRARTMAMHHTEELKEVIQVVFDQFVGLKIHVDHAGFILDYKEREDMHIWLADHQQGVPTEISIPYFDSPHWNSYREAKAKQESFFANLLPFEVKNQFYQDLFELIPELTEEAQQAIFSKPALAISTVLLDNVGLYIEHYSMTPYTADENKILMRFGKVFQQTYTRFLDLQKAEAQAKEAQIEASLERMRAAAMAMHKAGDLMSVCKVMNNELIKLGFPNLRNSQIIINNDANRFYSNYEYSEYVGESLTTVPYDSHPKVLALVNKIQESADAFFVEEITGAALTEWRGYRISLGQKQDKKLDAAKAVCYYMYSVDNGALGISTFDVASKEHLELLYRFRNVFKLAYKRFTDIEKAEAQAREAKIEAALERVRSRSMAMHKSEELAEVSLILFEQVEKLGIKTWSTGFNVWLEDDTSYIDWVVNSASGKFLEPYKVDLTAHPSFMEISSAKKQGCDFFVHETEGETLEELYRLLSQMAKTQVEDIVKAGFQLPEHQINHYVFGSKVSLMFITFDPCPEAHDIFKRFGKVFEQTYTRFLDLQRAEAQARESQIQLALERVRARTMAMQHSDELMETSELMFEQIKNLGIELWSCGFSLWYDDDSYFLGYNPGPHGKLGNPLRIPLTEDIFFTTIREAKRRGDEFLVFESEGESLVETYRYMDGLPVVGETMRGFVEAGFPLPTFQVTHCGFFSNGHLMFITQEPNSEAVDIFKRFTKVFNQTYTRFLDLQKAEAQAREAQIEAALEKVRSRSLAMHKSGELKEVVSVLFEKLKDLQIPFTAVGIATNIEGSKDLNAFVCGQNDAGLVITNYRLPYFDNPVPKDLYSAIEEQLDYFVGHYSKEEKDAFYNYVIEHTDEFRHLPEDIKRMIFDSTTYTISMVAVQHAVFNINDFEGKILAENEIDIIKRFARVFDQAYIRFHDLQKAEAQAREAQIEAALERVRAGAMGMHRSDELSDVLSILFEQFDVLDIRPVDVHLDLFDLEKNTFSYRATGKTGTRVIAEQIVDIDARPEWQSLLERWQKCKPNTVEFSYYPKEVIRDLMVFFPDIWASMPLEAIMVPEEDFPDGIYDALGYCKFGFLGFHHHRKTTEEENKILIRFANEFERLYQRFLDLQRAEAQAREAQIEAALERVRSKSLAMHKTAELQSVIHTVHQELLNLNISISGGSFIVINSEIDNEIHCWGSGGTADTSDRVHIPHFEKPFYTHLLNGIKNGPGFFTEEYTQEEKIEFFTFLFHHEPWSKLSAKEKKNTLAAPGGYTRSCAVAKHTSIFIINHFGEKFSQAENAILKRFGKVFDQTYTRFLDLQKAEAQARESQIQLSLERIRAKAMSMQHSDELSDFLTVLFEQFEVLNLRPVNCILSLFDIENNRSTFRMTGKKGSTLIASQEIDLDASPVWKQKVENWKSGHPNDVDVLYIPYENLPEIAEIFKEILEKLPEDERPLPEDYPNGEYIIDGYCKYGYLGYAGSGPPSEEEKEITRRIANEFGNVYQRFLDLQKAEAQAREAEIQLALERVRARSLAMHRSEELADISLELVKQVQTLGMESWFCAFNIYDDDPRGSVEWGSNGKGTFPQYRTPREGVFLRYFEAGQRGETLLVNEIGEEACPAHYEYLCSLPGVGEQLLQMKAAGIPFPTSQIDHVAFFKYGYVLFITYEPAPESHDIFKRFAKVFEQTYTRFLDIQKAEEQAREAQIENALEKVRSRTMAMQRSDELTDVAGLLFNQVSALGIKTWTTGFNVWSEDNNSYVDYLSLNGEIYGPNTVHTEKAEALKELSNARKSGVEFDVLYVEGEKIKQLYLAISGIDEKEYDIMVKDGLLPSQQYEHFVFGAKVSVMFITYEPVPEAHDIFKRLGKVFEQTYTRFLDLQRAEAQARESEIEVALEKVRSRSLAMHKSDELKDVVFSVFERLRDLQIQTDSTNIAVYHDESEKVEFWTANEMNYATKFTLPMTERFYPIEGEKFRKEQKVFLQHLHFEEKNRFWEDLFETSDFRKVPEARKNFLLEKTDCLTQLIAFGKVTGIMLNRYFNTPFSDADIEITERFAKVFDQAYTRFLDLQKAEAQARESQIANALEKVRSRSLAMQSPDELNEVAQLLREEMGALGVEELETSSIYIQDESRGLTQCWFTIKNPDNPDKAITDQMTLDLQDTWVGRKMDEFCRSKAKQTSILMQGEQRIEWIRYCEEKTELFGSSNFYGETIPDRTYHLYKFSNGYIGAAAPGEISSESWELLKRATAVFSFAYTRFRDLQMAQASARTAMRQASLDRVRAEISSMRHVSDLERITPLFFQELTTLGIPFIRCGVFIIQEKQEIVEAYLSSPDGNSLGVLRLPYQASELTYQTVQAWRKGVIYRQHWNKEDFIQWINQLMEEDQIQDSSTYQGTAAPPESLDLHFVPFKQGMLYVGAVNPLEENELELVQALAKAFSIAYARYEDFVKLENAKVEIESAMIELKATQSQLVQQEKLASLGQLTAGIAHEIKNPLNFVNNFSEVSMELIEEAMEERSKSQESRDETLVYEILEDIKSNLTKIHEHGTRANGIVSSMLQHSRGGSGKMEPTDLNALIKEYVNLSFHGMRAGKSPINVDIQLDLDQGIKEVSLIKEDFTRVIINLCNNAFDAMRGKKYQVSGIKYQDEEGNDIEYLPKLNVTTSLEKGQIRITIQDNGPGIPDEIKDKILQPFFTTKKGTEGTGLGLSITHDIIKAHGGSLSINSDGNGSVFTITIPTNS